MPGQLDSDVSLGLDFDTLAAELELGVDRAVEHEVRAVSVERRHWWVVRYLWRR